MSNWITMEELKKRLQARQCKLTPQRRIVLEAFLRHVGKHLSAEEVHLLLRQENADIGLATVYRTLELLSEMDILHKMDFGDKRSRYELSASNDQHQHHHLICMGCGSVREFADDLLEPLEQGIAAKCKFTVVDHQVKFYGYCRECQAKRES